MILPVMKRDWRGYSAERLNAKLSTTTWESDIDQVQHFWNALERSLIVIVDELAPMVPFINNSVRNNVEPPTIRNKLNIRRRLLRAIKHNPNDETRMRIKILNIEIKSYYYGKIRLKV